MLKLYHSDNLISLKRNFDCYVKKRSGIENPVLCHRTKLRDYLIDWFRTAEFQTFLGCLATEIGEFLYGSLKNVVVQRMPTPRIFAPGDHGTSLHCDYWYGHGVHSHTVWVPLSDLDAGNTFLYCEHDVNEHLKQHLEKNPDQIDLVELKKFSPALPALAECVIFSSDHLHASTLNSSSYQRISFDFRIALATDQTSTKHLGEYKCLFDSEGDVIEGKGLQRCLKYICGGVGRHTLAQHVLIENIAREKNFDIVAQEAEFERLGYPVLRLWIESYARSKGIDCILIASKSILDDETAEWIGKSSEISVYACLEGEYLSTLSFNNLTVR